MTIPPVTDAEQAVTDAEQGPRFALVSWQVLPAIFPRSGSNVGGAETGLWGLAQTLGRLPGLRVAVATSAPHSGYPGEHQGVDLWLSVDRFAAMRRSVSSCIEFSPRLRWKRFAPRLLFELPVLAVTRPWRPRDPLTMEPDPRLAQRHPDVWGAFGNSGDTARTVATALMQQRPSIVFIQSNADLDERLAGGDAFTTRWGDTAQELRFVLRHATEIVCQSRWQLDALQQRFGRRGHLIRNPIDVSAWSGVQTDQQPYALWIGRYDDFHKRPLLMLQAAAECPAIPFKLVINRLDPTIERQVRRSCPANVELIDYVPFDQMPSWFAGARLFVSTGAPDCEGFPNVLLQAAAAGTPIVSLEDFDGFLAASGAGVDCGGSIARLAAELRSRWQKPAIDRARVERYLADRHAPERVAGRVADLIRRLAPGEQRSAREPASGVPG